MADIGTILISAGVGALAASVIPSISAWLDRRWRKKELLLRLSVDLGIDLRKTILQVSTNTRRPAELDDAIVLAEVFHGWLNHLLEKGALPDDPRINRSDHLTRPRRGDG